MSISPSLQASARAAYRSLFRAASVTFSGKYLVVIHLCGSRHVSKSIGDDRVLNGIHSYEFIPRFILLNEVP